MASAPSVASPHYIYFWFIFKNATKTAPDESMVIDEQHSDLFGPPDGRGIP
jgi:hypothetical protein